MTSQSAIFYRDRSQQYAPRTPDETAQAAHALAADGFSDSTIAAILRLDVAAVRQLIGQRAPTTAANAIRTAR
jgi:hypothetical protein